GVQLDAIVLKQLGLRYLVYRAIRIVADPNQIMISSRHWIGSAGICCCEGRECSAHHALHAVPGGCRASRSAGIDFPSVIEMYCHRITSRQPSVHLSVADRCEGIPKVVAEQATEGGNVIDFAERIGYRIRMIVSSHQQHSA